MHGTSDNPVVEAKGEQPRRRARSAKSLQKRAATRLQLVELAGKLIGRYGYAGCTIGRLAAKARVAYGSFYLHFKSQQDLFDSVLPILGQHMLDEIGHAIHDSKDLIDLEKRGFEANLAYLIANPYLHRVVTEAQLYAPKAFQQHMDAMTESYRRSLERSLAAGHIPGFSPEELEAVATMLIGARAQLLTRYGTKKGELRPLPQHTIETYLKFVAHGLARG
jgi:AcrR family transcriptional regulator